MKKYFIIILLATLIFSACKIDDSVGSSIQPPQDAIKVVVDTFRLASADFMYDSISAQCDSVSMLLGEFYNAKYGSTKAELIVQVAPPLNLNFADSIQYSPQPDSVIMILFYPSWFGATAEPLEIAIYELNKATPNYYDFYPATFDISEFIDVNSATLLGSKITATLPDSLQNETMGSVLHNIRYKFDDQWTQYFFDIAKKKYTNIDDFTNKFKGFYITTTYGQSAMLYLFRIEMRLYYHYTYQINGETKTVPDKIVFPANNEVRQLNKISHINTQNIINTKSDTVNYIKTAGGIYPKVTIPLGSLRKHINDSIGNKILSINSAILSVEATEIDTTKKLPIAPPQNVLLLPMDEATNFFQVNSLDVLKNNKAVLAAYNTNKKEYTFDLAYLLTNLIDWQNKKGKKEDYTETKEFILVPVDIYSNDIKPQKYIKAVTVRSAKSKRSPMRLELVYSGF